MNFKKADSVYPQYHSAFEITKFIKEHKSEINNPKTQTMILDTIKEKYYVKAPPMSL